MDDAKIIQKVDEYEKPSNEKQIEQEYQLVNGIIRNAKANEKIEWTPHKAISPEGEMVRLLYTTKIDEYLVLLYTSSIEILKKEQEELIRVTRQEERIDETNGRLVRYIREVHQRPVEEDASIISLYQTLEQRLK